MGSSEVQLFLDKNKFILNIPYGCKDFQLKVSQAKTIGGYFWNKNMKFWEYPPTKEVYLRLKLLFEVELEEVENHLNRQVIDIRKHDFIYPPFEHQGEALRFIFDQFGFSRLRKGTGKPSKKENLISIGVALFMDMGTGKTKTVIDVADILYREGEIENVIVVCPLSLVDTWGGEEGEIKKHSKTGVAVPIVGYNKPKKIKQLKLAEASRKSYKGGVTYVIIGIESIDSLKEDLKGYLKNFPCDLIIVDESTTIKNDTSTRSDELFKLFGGNPYKIIATGNPIPKTPEDIFGQYKLADIGIFGKSRYSFKERFFELDFFKKHKGWKRREEYEEKFHRIAFVRRKDQCLDLPPKIYKKLIIPMSKEQKKAYETMKKDAILTYNDLSATGDLIITKLMRMSQICGGMLPLQNDLGETVDFKFFNPNPKLDALVDHIEKILPDEQIVIWAHQTKEIKLISDRLTKEGFTNVIFNGTVNYKKKLEARRAFREKEVRCFIGNPSAGGKGLNDLIAATQVVYYSNNYKTEDRQQSEDRNHRNGTIKVLYTDLLMENSIDLKVLSVLKNDQDLSDAILDRDSSFFA